MKTSLTVRLADLLYLWAHMDSVPASDRVSYSVYPYTSLPLL